MNSDKTLIELFVAHFIARLAVAGADIPAAELEVCRKLLQDNAITFASVRAGDFGKAAQAAADDFPFNEDGTIKGDTIMGVRAN